MIGSRGQNGRHCKPIRDERGRVIDEALALDQRRDPARNPQTRRNRVGRDGVGRCDECAEHEADRPRQTRDRCVTDRGNGKRRGEYESDREQ
jgi:hypothetical protein